MGRAGAPAPHWRCRGGGRSRDGRPAPPYGLSLTNTTRHDTLTAAANATCPECSAGQAIVVVTVYGVILGG